MFSPQEERVIKILGDKTLTIEKISKAFYKSERPPVNPRNVMSQVIRRVNQKCEYHKLDWFINGMGLGRAGRTVWKDKR